MFSSLLYYGESFNTFTALIIRWFPNWGAFEVRHFFNSLTGVLGILFTGILAKETGSWKTGIIAMLVMALTPAYLGHSMNNPTDIPFATGFVASVYFLIRLLKSSPKLSLVQSLYVGLAIGMTMSIRVGALMLFAYVGLFMGISFLYQYFIKRIQFGTLFVDYAKSFIIIVLVGYALGVAFWPYALQSPLKNPFLALAHSTDPKFFVISYELFEGKKIYMGDAPWYYVIKFMSITIPIVFLIGVLFFMGLYFKMKKTVNSWVLLACGFVFIFPILTALYKDLMVYNAWRHYLFVFPFFAVIAASGWTLLEQEMGNKILKMSVLGLFGLLLIPVVYWNVANHPNQYVYYNEFVGGTAGAYGKYETDYYSNSVREATEWLIENEKLKHKKTLISTNNEVLTSQYYAQRLS
ncbi:MAG: hypothetical protein K2Q22_03245, partial [Cytophagales bacterium]|nr:hypothetical protein [Cytophagales bacterium]